MQCLDVDYINESPLPKRGCAERRIGNERRQDSSRNEHHQLVGGQRKGYCRRSPSHNYFVDWYNPIHLAVAAGIMMLSVFDAFMTMAILSLGGTEVNLLMDCVIQKDYVLFVKVKLLLTGLGVIFLTRYIHFKLFNTFKVSDIMLLALSGYIALIAYQFSCLM